VIRHDSRIRPAGRPADVASCTASQSESGKAAQSTAMNRLPSGHAELVTGRDRGSPSPAMAARVLGGFVCLGIGLVRDTSQDLIRMFFLFESLFEEIAMAVFP
jgi:hypothetical protein